MNELTRKGFLGRLAAMGRRVVHMPSADTTDSDPRHAYRPGPEWLADTSGFVLRVASRSLPTECPGHKYGAHKRWSDPRVSVGLGGGVSTPHPGHTLTVGPGDAYVEYKRLSDPFRSGPVLCLACAVEVGAVERVSGRP